jgi:hypothetical protein
MIKKFLAALAALALFLPAGAALAQMSAFPPAVLEAMRKEPPVTAADLDLYIKALPQMPQAIQGGEEGLVTLYENLGLSQMRFTYIMSKIGIAHSLAMGRFTPEEMDKEGIPQFLRPTEAEKAMVDGRMDELNRIVKDMGQSLQGGK